MFLTFVAGIVMRMLPRCRPFVNSPCLLGLIIIKKLVILRWRPSGWFIISWTSFLFLVRRRVGRIRRVGLLTCKNFWKRRSGMTVVFIMIMLWLPVKARVIICSLPLLTVRKAVRRVVIGSVRENFRRVMVNGVLSCLTIWILRPFMTRVGILSVTVVTRGVFG